MFNRKKFIGSLAMSTVLLATQSSADAEVLRKKFNANEKYLVIEILDDDLAYFEFSATGNGPMITEPLYTSPMVFKKDYLGAATTVSQVGEVVEIIETSEMRLAVDKSTLCVEVIDKTKSTSRLTTVCPEHLSDALKGVNIEPSKMQNVYGLGQEFKQLGSSDGDWIRLGIRQGEKGLGNGFPGFQNAAVGNVQIPVYYAVGADNLNYALFMDNVYWQKWDFKQTWWQARMYGDQLRFYVMTGKDLADLRSDFMELTGRPPVPPRKAFGLWVSEFGYDNWAQVDNLKDNLRTNKFPVDGFVLDLNWFGGISPKTNMGRLSWDADQDELATSNEYSFPNPSKKINEYAEDDIRLAVIEESYLAETTPRLDTFRALPENLLAYQRADNKCDPTKQEPVTVDGFWGKGRMFDWSDVELGKWIHNNRRFPELVKKGINTHWTDLGEPEGFDPSACYEGVETTAAGRKNKHSDIHNIYNLL